ncbi:MAG: hypothetical protein C0488_15485, partial [Arthrobacter sp.]|nr:hypothetical protein [Arthrobacter sp.]
MKASARATTAARVPEGTRATTNSDGDALWRPHPASGLSGTCSLGNRPETPCLAAGSPGPVPAQQPAR